LRQFIYSRLFLAFAYEQRNETEKHFAITISILEAIASSYKIAIARPERLFAPSCLDLFC